MPPLAEAHPVSDASRSDEATPPDARLELVDRIASTPAFQKAIKLQALLRFIVSQSLLHPNEEISEVRIGLEVFEKGDNYSPLLDSSVRVQARQLRLKLHEYFDGPGRDEDLVLEIPKGSYKPVFRSRNMEVPSAPTPPVTLQSAVLPESESYQPNPKSRLIPKFALCIMAVLAVFVLALAAGWFASRQTPWPLQSVLNRKETTQLIVADSAYQIEATATGKPLSLNEYRRFEPRNENAVGPADTTEARFDHALNGGTFTSFSDVVVVRAVAEIAGRSGCQFEVKSARDADSRDFEHGNFIISGSPSSNPWANLYLSQLHFREVPNPNRPGSNQFLNLHPEPGEPATFAGSTPADSMRTDYVDLAVVPGVRDDGKVMLIQGLRHDGTEAVARMLLETDGAAKLSAAFKKHGYAERPTYFEAILLVQVTAGIPHVTSVSAVRVLQR